MCATLIQHMFKGMSPPCARPVLCVRGLVKGMGGGGGMMRGAVAGAAGGGREGGLGGSGWGTRGGLAGDFWGTRALFGGTRSENGVFSSGFGGTRPRPRPAFIILKGGNEVLDVACGALPGVPQ